MTHIILDIRNIENNEVLKTIDGIKPLMIKIIEDVKLNVVNQCEYQFQPWGATLLYLLAESHFSVHTFVQEKKCNIDLYCCKNISSSKIDSFIAIIYDFFKFNCDIQKIVIDR